MEVSGQLHASAALPTGKEPLVFSIVGLVFDVKYCGFSKAGGKLCQYIDQIAG
jgi:hypothetical protein